MTMTSSTSSVYGVEVVVSLSLFVLSPRPRAGWPRGAETAKGTGFTRRPDAPSLTCPWGRATYFNTHTYSTINDKLEL